MSSHETSLAYGDMRRVSEMEAQLASAQAAALLAQADAETLRAGVLAYFVLPHEISDHRLRVQLIDLARAEHPGQAMADEVALARAANAVMVKALGQLDRHRVGACESDFGGMPDPCEECGGMRDIASEALARVKAGPL